MDCNCNANVVSDCDRDRWRRRVLIVGNYCHDTINPPPGGGGSSRAVDTLGGSAAYVSNVLDSLRIECEVIAKVGADFAYASRVLHAPLLAAASVPTTHFVADYAAANLKQDRILHATKVCDAILPGDLAHLVALKCGNKVRSGSDHCSRCFEGGDSDPKVFDLGLAVGVAGEILPETLETIIDICDQVIVDLQALIRVIHPGTGEVTYQKLEDGPFERLLHRITFLKAAQSEAKFLDVQAARNKTSVIVTHGDKGSIVYLKNAELQVPAFPTLEVDPTGAGDSFLGGFVAGLHGGLPIQKAALLGNYFGALAVSQVGVPRFTELQLQDCQKVFESLEQAAEQQ